ncbi:MAG: serine/threonine-protein kinase [Pirellulaceae bacterium]
MRFTYQSGSSPLDGYVIKRGVGAGGFGEVYYAVTPGGKEVALKHIQRNLDIEMRGAQHCLNLKHPHLVSLHDIRYDSTGEGWIIMEYIRGESLQDAIEKYPEGMPRETVMRWFTPICQGVGYLHDHGIVHRDLKPGNIFDDADTIKIGDYGLSKFISLSQRSGQTESIGTVHYMAPEIGKGRYGKEIDIYALGVILYQIVTGRLPFDGESTQEVLYKHMLDAPDLQGIEQPYRDVIAAALVKDPEKRTHSATDMLAALAGEATPSAPFAAAGGPRAEVHRPADDNFSDLVAPLPLANVSSKPKSKEPVARAVGQMMGQFSRWMQRDSIHPLVKILVMTGLILALVSNIGLLLPLGVLLGASYLTYLMIRTIILNTDQPPLPRFDGEIPANSPYHPTAMQRKKRAKDSATWHLSRGKRERAALALRSPVERMRELIGSLAVSGVVAAILALLMAVLGGSRLEDSLLDWAPLYAWLTVVTTCGAWGVLIAAKFWENRPEEQAFRRCTMLGVGMLLGVIAWGMLHLLMIEPIVGTPHSGDANSLWFDQTPYYLSNEGFMGGLLIYFAALLLGLRWWKLADPLRKTRLSLWAIGYSVLWAVILMGLFPFDKHWGLMLAGAISLAVQLSAPWLNSSERDQLRRQYELTAQQTMASKG